MVRVLPVDRLPAAAARREAGAASVAAGQFEVRGYALAGGGRSWAEAELLEDLGPWAWRLWRAQVQLEPGRREIVARAWDSAAGTQPEDPATVWNPKGYVNNAWPRVRADVT